MKKHLMLTNGTKSAKHFAKAESIMEVLEGVRPIHAAIITAVFAIVINLTTILILDNKNDEMYAKCNEVIASYNELASTLEAYDLEHRDITSDIDGIKTDIDSIEESQKAEREVSEANEAESSETETHEVVEDVAATNYIVEKDINLTNIAESSNLDAETFNYIINTYGDTYNLSNHTLRSAGEAIVKMEEEYNINGLFCLAVCGLESGSGTSYAAREYNNLFGLMANSGNLMKFETIDDCIMYWGKLIRNNYVDYGLTSIGSIQGKYCPGSTSWAPDVRWLFSTYANMV